MIKPLTHVVSLSVGVLALGLLGCASGPNAASGEPQYEEGSIVHQVTAQERAYADSREPIGAESAVLWVNGLGCPLCATAIDKQLLRMDGVGSARVDLSEGKVYLGLTGQRRPSPHALGEAVKDAGFTLVKVELPRG